MEQLSVGWAVSRRLAIVLPIKHIPLRLLSRLQEEISISLGHSWAFGILTPYPGELATIPVIPTKIVFIRRKLFLPHRSYTQPQFCIYWPFRKLSDNGVKPDLWGWKLSHNRTGFQRRCETSPFQLCHPGLRFFGELSQFMPKCRERSKFTEAWRWFEQETIKATSAFFCRSPCRLRLRIEEARLLSRLEPEMCFSGIFGSKLRSTSHNSRQQSSCFVVLDFWLWKWPSCLMWLRKQMAVDVSTRIFVSRDYRKPRWSDLCWNEQKWRNLLLG